MSLIPQLLDFIFTEKLGKGSYATVYKAYKKDDKREVVAVKCVQISSLTKSAVENLLTEISILKKVKHEYIVQLKDFQWDSNYIYLILEFCSGGDLSHFIRRRRRLPESIVQKFLQQLAKALQVLRSHNISHMDLKPQNILLSSTSHPVLKLADFGFAQYLYPDSASSSLRGSPLYMAPEILLKHHYDARADLWSVGIILYECLFGQAPFSSNTFSELAEKIKSSKEIELPYGARISEECRSLLLALLKRNPNDRLTFEQFFEHPFVDLEHVPTAESYAKGVEYAQQAVLEDSEHNFEAAVKLYSQALEYLVPHVSKEADHLKRKELRKKLFEYMNRAEQLKKSLQDDNSSNSHDLQSAINHSVSQGNLYNTPVLEKALNIALDADTLASQGSLEEANRLYQNALELMVLAVKDETDGQKKHMLYGEVDRWMRKAENLKSFIQESKLHMKGVEVNDLKAGSICYDSTSGSIASGCKLQ